MLQKTCIQDGLLGKSILRMEYIVFDLEWNQSSQKKYEVPGLPFEVIEIGGVKINSQGVMVGEFDELIKPTVYQEMHDITSRLIHLKMDELNRGRLFKQVAGEFLDWCGKEPIFCTWGSLDLVELQRNLEYYHMPLLGEGPFPYLDVQKLYALSTGDGRARKSLEHVVDELNMEKDIPFHRAFSDAYYTAKVFLHLLQVCPEILAYVSYDVYSPPADRASEVKVDFPTYQKYISRVFPDKQAAFKDREVASCKCYLCHRNLRKRVKWFSQNGRYYVCLAHCSEHGFFKGKNRIHKAGDGVFMVKTTKRITDSQAEEIIKKQEHLKSLKKKKNAED